MPNQTTAEWAEEWVSRDRERRHERRAWREAMDAQSYLDNARNPQDLVGFYDSDPEKAVNPGSITRNKYGRGATPSPGYEPNMGLHPRLGRAKSEFVSSIEAAYHEHRGQIPMEFWLQFSPEEVRAYGGGEFTDLAKWLEDAQYATAVEARIQQEIDANWETALEAQRNSRSFVDTHMDEDTFRAQFELIARGRGDELHEDGIADFMDSERRLFQMMRDGLEQGDFMPKRVPGQTEEPRFSLADGQELTPEEFERYYRAETRFLKEAQVEDITQMSDEEIEDILAEREALLRGQLQQNPRLTDVLRPGDSQGFIEGSMNAIGQVLDKGLRFGGLILDIPWMRPVITGAGFGAAFVPLDIIRAQSEQNKEEQIKAIQDEQGTPDREMLARFVNKDAQAAWQTLAEENPTQHGEYLRMGGMDPNVAFGFFQADLTSQISPEDQVKYLQDLEIQEEERINLLKDQNFTVGDDLLNLMAWWGRNVPGRLATGTMLLLSHSDELSDTVGTEGWGKFFEEVASTVRKSEAFDHTPSKAMGIDGSAAGLILDLSTGIMFDPTTWLFGPRLSSRSALAATKAQAQTVARSALVRQMADDVVNFARSPSRGASSMVTAADWLDPVSLGEFLNVVDFAPQTLRKTPWRSVKEAQEVTVEFAAKLLDDATLEGVGETAKLTQSILDEGFLNPITITVSRGDGTIWVSDGAKRIKAAEDGGITHVPAIIKVTDEVFEPSPSVSKGTVMEEVVNNPGEFVYHGTTRITDETLRLMDEGEESFTRGGLTTTRERAETYAESQRPISGSEQSMEGATGQVLIFRKSDLPEDAQRALNRGEDVEELFPTGDWTAHPDIRPVAHYSLNTGFPSLFEPAPLARRPGTPINAILREGEELGISMKKPGGNPDYTARPDAVLPRSQLLGELPYDEVYEIFERAIVERGAVPTGAHRAALARNFNVRVTKLLKANAVGRWLNRYMTPQGLATRFDLTGVHAMDKILDATYRLWGENTAKLDQWLEPLMHWQRETVRRSGEAARRLAELQPRRQRLAHLKDQLGPMYDDALKQRQLNDIALGNETAADIGTLNTTREGYERAKAAAQAQYDELVGEGDMGFPSYEDWAARQMAETDALTQQAADIRSDMELQNMADEGTPLPDELDRSMTISDDEAYDIAVMLENHMHADDFSDINPEALPKIKTTLEATIKSEQKKLADMDPAATRAEGVDKVLHPDASEIRDRLVELSDQLDAVNARMKVLKLDETWANKDDLRKLIAEEEKYLRRALAAIDRDTGALGATEALDNIVTSMWDDYNREVIAKNPLWADQVDSSTGMVPWDILRKGRKPDPEASNERFVMPEQMRTHEREIMVSMTKTDTEIIDVEELASQLSAVQNQKMASNVPISPLEMIMASQLGGAAYTRATHLSLVNRVRETALTMQRLWNIDKVFTVATAATVSFDELLRIFHIGGMKVAGRWAKDRAIFLQARTQALLHGKGWNRSAGAEFLSAKKQERLRRLSDFPTYLKQAERQTLEQTGLGWTDITPKEYGYTDAAKQWTAGFLQDSGFRAFLRGRESFREWFFSPDGQRLRQGVVWGKDDAGKVSDIIGSADEFFDGWNTVFTVILKEADAAGKKNAVRQAWKDIAAEIDAGGSIPKDLPDIAVNHLGTIRGVKRDIPNKVSVQRMQEGFFDRLFMDPVNYRRGFLADLARNHHDARLRSLFQDQGKRIVSDTEVEAMLGLQGMRGSRTGLNQAIQEMALKSGVVPESYIDDLVERAVLNEIENTLYSFDLSSRMGTQSKVAFPFGKPWADMAAFWGREFTTRPVMRGLWNSTNAGLLRSASESRWLTGIPGFAFPGIPTRTHALLSRLAHTDFTIDQGLLGGMMPGVGDPEGILHSGGVIPGAEQSDFSPLFFLPTKGSNPLSYMLPGLGIVPLAFIDFVLDGLHDPVNEPQEYQALVDDLSQFVPSVHFQQGGFVSRVLGGGTLARTAGTAVDLVGMAGGDSFFNLTSELGDISREIDRTREISALMADPEELEMILSAKTIEEADLLIMGLAAEADQRASGSHAAEAVTRYMAPVGHDFDATIAEIEDVWLSASKFDQLAPSLRGRDIEDLTDDQRRQVANDIRSTFFSLPAWERDMLVVEQPSLAVNMIGSWEWTPKAINENVDGTQYAYRTAGTPAALARHDTLVQKGYIRPVQPIVRARRILGVIAAAQKNLAKELYETQTGEINTLLWEAVPEEIKAQMQWVADSAFGQEWGLRTAEEAWFKWNTIEADLEAQLAEESGIEQVEGVSQRKDDLTDFDKLQSAVSIPDEWKPWGAVFPGLEEEDVPERFNSWEVLEVDEKSAQIAEALGIPMAAGMSGEELYAEVQQIVTQQHTPAFDLVRPDYDRYIEDRSNRSGQNMLFEAAQSDLVAPEYQEAIHKFLFEEELMRDRYREESHVALQDQIMMREKFLFIMHGSKDQRTNWEGIWKEQYERDYGPLDWTPPEPASPFDENGDVGSRTMLPSVRHVVDGDTLLIQEYKGSPGLNAVRLLGIRAAEVDGPEQEKALEQEEALKDALLNAAQSGDNIYLVRDERFGNTDRYGRMLAWLWIGDEPFYNEEDLLPHQDPSGGGE